MKIAIFCYMDFIVASNTGELITIDKEDLSRLNQYKWSIYHGQPVRYRGKRRFTIANTVMENYDVIYDHKNRNPLDNRKENLRVCTLQQNSFNRSKSKNKSSKYRGVSFAKASNKWQVSIKYNKRTINLGLFTSEQEAALAYNRKATELFGEFANINVIEHFIH